MPFFWNYYIKSCYFCFWICKKLWKDTFNKTSFGEITISTSKGRTIVGGKILFSKTRIMPSSEFQRACLNEEQKWTEGKYTKSCETFWSFSQEKKLYHKIWQDRGRGREETERGKGGGVSFICMRAKVISYLFASFWHKTFVVWFLQTIDILWISWW